MIPYAIYGLASVVAPIFGKHRVALYALLAFLVWFVAFRFETGYDWPVYKNIFQSLKADSSLLNIDCLARKFSMEPVFIYTMAWLALITPEYEFAQAFFSLLFLASLLFLGSAFRLKNLPLFIALALGYVIFTVGFSTVRQGIAISFFNFAIGFYLRGSRIKVAVLLAAAVLFQYSAAIYVAAFVFTVATKRYRNPLFDLASVAAAAAAALAAGGLFLALARAGKLPSGERIDYYVDIILDRGITRWDMVFGVFLSGIVMHILLSTYQRERNDAELLCSRLGATLGIIAAGAVVIPVVRDRASYEMWILYAAYLSFNGTYLRAIAISGALAFSVFYAAYVPFRFPSDMMFIPYQNYVLKKLVLADYPERPYNDFISIFVEKMQPRPGTAPPGANNVGKAPADGSNLQTQQPSVPAAPAALVCM